jgi:hypothetical protein
MLGFPRVRTEDCVGRKACAPSTQHDIEDVGSATESTAVWFRPPASATPIVRLIQRKQQRCGSNMHVGKAVVIEQYILPSTVSRHDSDRQ